MNKKLFIVILICTIILAGTGGVLLYRNNFFVRDDAEEMEGRFDFYIYTTAPDNTLIPFPLTVNNQPVLEQPPRVYFVCLKNACLYLLLLSPEKEMTVLFPGPGGIFPPEYRLTRYFLPEDSNWDPYLQAAGEYTLYFVISTSRLKVMERILSRYATYCKPGQPDSAQLEIIAHFQATFETFRRDKEWIENTGEIPEWIDGTVRSVEEEVIYRAWQVPFRGVITHSLVFHYIPGEKNEGTK